jgi:amidase
MKPTRGRVPTLPAAEGWLGLTVFGALARTTADSALLLDVLSDAVDPAGGRPASPETFRAAAGRAPGRLRIAISRRVPPGLVASLASDQRLAFDRTARLLAELGHEVEERDPAYGLAALELTQTYLRGIAEDFARLADPTATERATRQMAAAGRVLVPVRRRDVLRARRPNTSARILELWRSHDVLLTPGLARTALPAEGWHGRAAAIAFLQAARFTPWTPIFNLTGQPAISIPAGIGADRMPLSVQLVGAPGGEAILYALAAQLEAEQPWSTLSPPLGPD